MPEISGSTITIPDPGLQQVTPGQMSDWRSGFPPVDQIIGSTLNSGGGTGSGSNVISTPGAAATPNTAQANPAANTVPVPTPTLTAGSLADYFARAIIIILGFIFVAVGLNMLRPGTVPISIPKGIRP